MKSLRILQVMRSPVGGLFRHVADLTRALAERGHMVGLFADSEAGDGQTDAKLAALEPVAALGIHRFPIPRLLGAHDFTTPLKIRSLARSLDVDILHGHGAKGGFGARLARIGGRRPATVYTPHGGALHFDPHTLSGGTFMAIERALLGATDALIFESAYAQRIFASHVARPRCRQEVIHNGLADAEFETIEPAPDAADFVFVGELRLLKGIDLIVDALAPLKRPDGTPATIIMAGDGPDAEMLRAKIGSLGLEQRVTLAGVQPARTMFTRGRCVLVPSRAESLPYIVMEAAAAGRPVIATNVGGIAEIFGPTSGRLIAADSADALRQAMTAFLANPSGAASEAQERRAFVRSRFSLSRMVDGIEALYRDLSS
ncbi:glycosyltransferase family 4 protein [Pelagibacterium sp. H642]|uniref:glycosyltransferase family 4 protein n=1 Tax=Pelagibacterium sp. H642 TaxID=1881069 RepID=UPI002815A87C|nr:glycosyltransferase family 4 protein [Pelagibacterium sp. H642]WMT90756.1 glycosyltransferase family 4 protein [Pelagibacterium sp. H642]